MYLSWSGVRLSQAGYVSNDPYEMEADHFAAGLLMPERLFKQIIKGRDPGLSVIENAGAQCKTSLTAAAIRYADLTEYAVAVIISTGQLIDFCFMSDTMKSLPQLSWLKKGAPVPRNTETARFNADPSRILIGDRATIEIDVLDWLGGQRSAIVTEEVVGLGRYGKTLTVLSSAAIGREDEGEDDEDELIDKWTPRFHR
ncbi:ImmA/IrrE family metallo-endopeptidase [Ferrovibrio xuzhouensis]|uniref:ImmA/IrrE family metallo-endopeptidase n=1 Tax=Ferrovibrio xuzhouensis TaxID=1576914 RepID=A0ABV7VLR1_9PROT